VSGEGWTSRLLTGCAGHLQAAGIGVWRDSGIYTAAEVGIVMQAIPSSPDPVSSIPGLADITQGLQVRVRGTQDPRVAQDLGDAIFDLLDSASGLRWGGIPVVQVYRQSYASLGTDTGGRWQVSHNYYVDAMRATTNRTD
jgi:hypothetical protein